MEGMLSRRKVLAASGGLLAFVATGGWIANGLGAAMSPDRSPFDSAAAARRAGWTVVTDFGAVGDGRSRPLSIRYRSVAAARRDFPGATDLDAELDGLAMQTAIDSGASRIYYPPGRYLHNSPLLVRDGQRHIGAGPSTTLLNVRPRTTSLDSAQAHSFQIGNIHPAAMVADDSDQAWTVWRLAPVAAGSRSVSVEGSVRSPSVVPGDIVMIRSDNPPTTVGNGLIYDFQMWNRVTAWDSVSGTLSLELPVPRDIAEFSTSPTELSGPKLCLNSGSDLFLGQPWSIVQNVEIGYMRLESAGLSSRNGVWRGWFHDLILDAENMVTFNALVASTVERVSGTWGARMLEIKHSSHNSTVRSVNGTFRAAQNVTVLPAVSVGEQSFDCSFDDINCWIGPTCRDPVRALELSSPRLQFRGTLHHRGNPLVGQVWAIKSNDSPANPPVAIDLELTVRTAAGFSAYGIIGNTTPRRSFPSDVALRLDQRSDGIRPGAAIMVVGGSGIRVADISGDVTCAAVGGGVEVPTGIDICS